MTITQSRMIRCTPLTVTGIDVHSLASATTEDLPLLVCRFAGSFKVRLEEILTRSTLKIDFLTLHGGCAVSNRGKGS